MSAAPRVIAASSLLLRSSAAAAASSLLLRSSAAAARAGLARFSRSSVIGGEPITPLPSTTRAFVGKDGGRAFVERQRELIAFDGTAGGRAAAAAAAKRQKRLPVATSAARVGHAARGGDATSSRRAEKALTLLRAMPRLNFMNLEDLPGTDWGKKTRGRGQHGGGNHSKSRNRKDQGGMYGHCRPPKLGWEGGSTPFHHRVSVEPSYNYGLHAKRQYPPISLQRLQLWIDTGRIDPSRPIDLAALCGTRMLDMLSPAKYHFGVNLTAEGADNFEAKVNVEVQWASEQTIAAVESRGGTITTAYFDVNCLRALINPLKWFESGEPIPRRLTPPNDALDFYTNAANRGYLADPHLIAEERFVLAQKYGYELPDLGQDPDKEMLLERKDPRQVFFGLEPGWLVNLKDRVIYKPTDPELKAFYAEEAFHTDKAFYAEAMEKQKPDTAGWDKERPVSANMASVWPKRGDPGSKPWPEGRRGEVL